MIKEQYDVLSFMVRFGQPVADMPQIPSLLVKELARKLIREEVLELESACDEESMVDIADAIADLLYVVYWAANAYGINMEGIFYTVHNTNMNKIGGGQREDGKILKPDGWEPPTDRIIADLELQTRVEDMKMYKEHITRLY